MESTLSVAQLKEFLRARGLSVSGTKAELLARLTEADPTGDWRAPNTSDANDSAGDDGCLEDDMCRREVEIYRREKEIAERELELARREIALLRESRDPSQADRGRQEEIVERGNNLPALPRARLNLTAIADLLADFDGSPDGFDVWEKQIRLLKTTYQLDNDHTRILVGMKLKKRALEWFHSKPEFIGMTFDVLMSELRTMFGHRQSKITTRRRFGGRIWKKNETFREYVHDKVIMGNRVPIAADEIIEHVIDGIPAHKKLNP
ncbi:PREDICTED: uncharacterized protein LOC105556196 [Vollenhovia emeryi]|uniref:uncharacterized protein LOC105556196 n=1 Tax=Vollenhovia emeryi TaxID=411798 RepID=UPI0005F373B6|nr:PREDICTED: uncharacterized protein LOC105556196 [Vollenhovia emeryi]